MRSSTNDSGNVENGSDNASHFMCGVVEGFYGRPWTSEQRKTLFKRMNKVGMNTYLYAPKDDYKHRVYWRDLYTVDEAENLRLLIQSAEEEDVTFMYALSPGLDMAYSSSKEVASLKRKLEQVSSFGCKAFALLFDDIEVAMSEGDKEIFQSFAQAQVFVTNEVYQHLGEPDRFLFCPTEYCATRAAPNVATSDYLTTLGSKLLPGIDIMWTGPQVVSKKITIKSIEEITAVLHRAPVIWDNIHANDYDQRRLYLGPYDGRSSELLPYLRGVLTNPNCEFESNFIALHTLAEWSKSNVDGVKKDFILSESPMSADIKLETEGDFMTDDDIPLNTQGYQPRLALSNAIKEWLKEFYNERIPINPKMSVMLPTDTMVLVSNSQEVILQSTINGVLNSSYVNPITLNLVNSLVDTPSEAEEECKVEPMDCAVSVGGASSCSSDDDIDNSSTVSIGSELCLYSSNNQPSLLLQAVETMQVDSDINSLNDKPFPTPESISACVSIDCSIPLPTPSVSDICSTSEYCSVRLTEQDVHILVQLFYLPFEHGTKGTHLLNEFHWLKTSSQLVAAAKAKDASDIEQSLGEDWQARSECFCVILQEIYTIFKRFCSIPNKTLISELFPYIWDMTVVLHQMHTFISWLGLGVPALNLATTVLQGNPCSWSSVAFRELFSSGNEEPWVFRGGLQAEFQRMLPLEGSPDLLMMVYPTVPVLSLNKIRPYQFSDQSAVYEVCRRTCDDGCDGTEIFADQPELIGDQLVGAFLTLSPEYCFVIEDEEGICGYVLAAPCAKEFHKKTEMAWIPALKEKYPLPSKDSNLTPSEEIIASLHKQRPYISTDLFSHHPAIVRLNVITDRILDPTSPKRAMAAVAAALKVCDTRWIHAEINVGDHTTVESYTKLGFADVALPDTPEDVIYMGRII